MKDEDTVTLEPPLEREEVENLDAGDLVEISGTVFTARDKAYEKILQIYSENGEPPLDLDGGIIYHCGPLAKPTEGGWEIIAAGPTTSARLDDVQIDFVKNTGVRALIGKGGVGRKVAEELGKLGCVYLAFPGGAASIGARSIQSVEDVIWEDLGSAEAVWVLEMEGFGPLTVGTDLKGENLYLRE